MKEMIEDRKTFVPIYFDRDGKEMTLMEWGDKCEDIAYRSIMEDTVDRWTVSTIWIGLDMGIFRIGLPLIFETMIFMLNEDDKHKDDPLEYFQDRYSTEKEAIFGHYEVINMCKKQLEIEKEMNPITEPTKPPEPSENLVYIEIRKGSPQGNS